MIKTNDCIENKATFRVPVLPAASRLHRRTGTLQSCFAAENSAVTCGSSATAAKSSKFRFHIKFKPKSMAAALGPRSVLRCHPPTRTCYTRRRNCPTDAAAQLIKHAFFPVSSTPRRQQPSLQISQTEVLRGEVEASQLRRSREESETSWLGRGGVGGPLKGRGVRDLHNSLERQRRIDLKNAFDTLKIRVPEIAASDKASKLLILTKARDFCVSLGARETQLKRERERLRLRQESLANRVRLLQRGSKAA